MAESPSWLPGHLGIVAVCYTIRFLMLGTGLAETSGNAFVILAKFAAFTIEGLPPFVNFVFFMILPLPLIVHIATLAFSNTATTIVGLVTAGVGAIISFFT